MPLSQNPKTLIIPLDKAIVSTLAVCSEPPPTGACLLPSNESCGTEKTLDISLPNLMGLLVTGFDNKMVATWDTNISYPDQLIRFMYRRVNPSDGGYFDSPKTVARDTGTIETIDTLTPDQVFEMFFRAEDADGFGYWTRIFGITTADWTSDSDIVAHYADDVYIGSDIVIHER